MDTVKKRPLLQRDEWFNSNIYFLFVIYLFYLSGLFSFHPSVPPDPTFLVLIPGLKYAFVISFFRDISECKRYLKREAREQMGGERGEKIIRVKEKYQNM